MDKLKCKSLKADLAVDPEPQIVPIERPFDSNDDLGSIGWRAEPEHYLGRNRPTEGNLLWLKTRRS
jgi:hypothetical protein